MQRIDGLGQPLGLALFTKAFRVARKLVPARFLVLRMNPLTFAALRLACEEVEEVVQIGETVGHLGKRQTKIACVKPSNGLGDGVTVQQDAACEESRIEFLVHGAVEVDVFNLYVMGTGIGSREHATQTIQ